MKNSILIKILFILVILLGVCLILKISSSAPVPYMDLYKDRCDDVMAYTIRDEHHAVVQEAREALLVNTQLSENYFNEHFTFDCAEVSHLENLDYPGKLVFFTYFVGEYRIQISLYNTSEASLYSGSAKFYYGGLDEIQKVISPDTAIKILTACIPGIPTQISLGFNSNGLVMTGELTDSGKGGSLNLETGECIKLDLRKVVE